MRIPVSIALAFLTTITVSVAADGQTAIVPSAAEAVPGKPPVEIVSHKIRMDYYPMLDRPSSTTPPMTADVAELPPTEGERLARQRTRYNNKNVAAPISPEDKRSRGRLYSYLRVIDDAQSVQIVIKNTDSRPIKSVDWDFAFPRYENGQLLPRYDVSSNVEIKPGAKKMLKHKLPAGAKRCEVVKVVRDEKQAENVSTFEAVCGQGFHDPQLQGQKQETISIKRIAYADGTVWTPQQ